ncbi:hypothetical protein SFUMM280S_07507 [Streptomyces fumanus]
MELVDAPGSLSWTELYTSDAAAAKEFYGGVLGWRFSNTELPGGGGTYSLITPAGLAEERMHGGVMEVPKEGLDLAGGRPRTGIRSSPCPTATPPSPRSPSMAAVCRWVRRTRRASAASPSASTPSWTR